MKKTVYRHIGYYNDMKDILNLFDKNADYIVSCYVDDIGHFYAASGESESDIAEDPRWEPDGCCMSMTNGKDYVVRKQMGSMNLCCDGWFIDIYERTIIDTDE